jgi:soluble lytic murein transglycosylase-like protein
MRRMLARLIVLAVGALALVGLNGVSTLIDSRHTVAVVPSDPAADSTTLTNVRAQLADARRELERTHQILEFATRYSIPADLATHIYDVAVAEGIPAAVGFQLVRVESGFENTARSSAAAIGLTQLRLSTARAYDATIDASDLMNADVNLRLGFRYLKDLLGRFDHSLPLALEAYNKGPTFVSAEQELGNDVEGRYSRAVMAGVRKKG